MAEPGVSIAHLHRLQEAGQWQRVLDLGLPLLATNPNDADLRGLLGHAALSLKKHRLAKEHLTACLSLEPDEPWPHRALARLHTAENRLLYAKKHLLTALQLSPEDGDTWTAYGANCAMRGDWITAEEALEQARSFAPEDAHIASLQAKVNAHRDDSEQSTKGDAFAQLAELQAALTHDPEDDFIFYQMGIIYFEKLADIDNAEECLRSALRLDPGDTDYRNALFAVLRRRDPIMRVLNGPMHLLQSREEGSVGLVIAMFLLVATLPFLWIPGKIYERMVLHDLRRQTGHLNMDARGFAAGYNLPFYLRFAAFALLSLLFIAGLLGFLLSPALAPYRGTILSCAFFIFMIVALVWSAKRPHQE